VDYATDEERVEELKKWWKENGTSLIVGVALGLSILLGWRWWTNYQETQSISASALYSQLENAVKTKNADKIKAYSGELFVQYENQIYASYAALTLAKSSMDANKPAEAVVHLRWALAHAKTDELKGLVTTRLARALLAAGKLDEALKIASLETKKPFQAMLSEIQGDILLAMGQSKKALAAYKKTKASLSPDARHSPTLQLKIDDLASVE